MSDLLSFRTMITPVIIQVVFWIGVIACVLVGAIAIIAPQTSPNSHLGYATGILILVLGPLLVRIYCELLMVIFRIHSCVEVIAARESQR